MPPLILNAALQELMKLCMLWEIDPDSVRVDMFVSHGGRHVLRGKTTVRGIVTTLDVYMD